MVPNNNPKKTEPSLDKSSSVLRVNLIIFLCYSVILPLFDSDLAFIGMPFHAIFLFFGGFFYLGTKDGGSIGSAMILSSLLLAMIGLSLCFGSIQFH